MSNLTELRVESLRLRLNQAIAQVDNPTDRCFGCCCNASELNMRNCWREQAEVIRAELDSRPAP